MTYTHPDNWLVLLVIMAAGVLIRQFFILRHKGKNQWALPVLAVVLLAAVAAWIMPPPLAAKSKQDSIEQFAQVQQVIQARCVQCHSEHPSLMEFPAKGVLLDTPAQIRNQAQLIYQQVVQQKLMPLGNLTHITEDERALIARWVESGAAEK